LYCCIQLWKFQLLCKGYLIKKESDGVLHQMTWPPQSPNRNPIEMVWDELDHRVMEKQPTSAQHMWELLPTRLLEKHLQGCWKALKLVERMPRVCKAVIKAKGAFFEEYKIYFDLFKKMLFTT
uniref:Tc1-like transposase DDE domain-containing protein n=1 Tax=Hucho hucho TaxID=62062 RepID=A0A4W5M1K8_9TELE